VVDAEGKKKEKKIETQGENTILLQGGESGPDFPVERVVELKRQSRNGRIGKEGNSMLGWKKKKRLLAAGEKIP